MTPKFRLIGSHVGSGLRPSGESFCHAAAVTSGASRSSLVMLFYVLRLGYKIQGLEFRVESHASFPETVSNG